jgi:hypothetical protein
MQLETRRKLQILAVGGCLGRVIRGRRERAGNDERAGDGADMSVRMLLQ